MLLVRSVALTVSIVLAFASVSGANAASYKHRHNRTAARYVTPEYGAPNGGRLVYHPASNIACNDVDKATRAIPCNQPVWVYGSPCEIDLGLGRSRPCDEPRLR
jgi:hypothetical protein